MKHSSKKSLFRQQSDSQGDHSVPSNPEQLIRISGPSLYHSKDEKVALEWIVKAFDLERFTPNAFDQQSQSIKNPSQTEHMNSQINKFNNSVSINSKVMNNSSKVYGISTQKLLFSLIRFDFLKNEENDIDYEQLISEATINPSSLENSKKKSTNNFDLKPIVIDPSKSVPDPTRIQVNMNQNNRELQENTGLPQQTSIKGQSNNQDRYKVNGGIACLEILEKVYVTFEAMKDNLPRITGKIILKQRGIKEAQEYQIKWPVMDTTQIISKESQYLQSKAHRFSKTSIGMTYPAPSSLDTLLKQDLYMYKLNPQFLRKRNTPVLVEPKFLDSNHDHLNLRLLLNPAYRDSFVKLDLKILTKYAPQTRAINEDAKLTQDGIETKLGLTEFGNDLSWATKIGLNKGNEVIGVWLIAHFNTVLCANLMPKVDIRIRNEMDHFSDEDIREVACDRRMMFEYQRKLVN
jgi:hypothetical protein